MNITPYSSATLSPASSTSSAELLAAYPALKRWWVHTRGVTTGGIGVGKWADQVVGETYSVIDAGGTIGTTSEGVNGAGNDSGLSAETDDTKRYTCEANTTLLLMVLGKMPTVSAFFPYAYGVLDGAAGVAEVAINKAGTLAIESAAGASESGTFSMTSGGVTALVTANYVVQAAVFDLSTATSSNRHQVQAATPASLFTENFAVNNTVSPGNLSTHIPTRRASKGAIMQSGGVGPMVEAGGHYSQIALFAFKNLRQNTLMDGIVRAACQWSMGNNSLLYPGFRGIV